MRILRAVGMFFVLVSIAACGGSGGGGGGGSGRSQGSFSIASSSVTFTGSMSGPIPAHQRVSGSITGVDSDVYLFVVHTTNGILAATVQVTGETTGELTIFPKPPGALSVGVFTDTVTVRACLDSNCSREIGGSPRTVNVTYNVTGISASPSSVTLTGIEGTASQAATVDVQNQSSSSNWTTSIIYGANTTGWLTVTPATGDSASPALSLVGGASLAPGSYTATVRFAAGGITATIPVTYNVTRNLSASVNNLSFGAITGQSAMPSAQTANVTTALTSTTFSTSVVYGPNASGWLNVSGSAAPGMLTVQPSRADLGPGTFTATVVLTPTTGASLNVPVTYTLAASSLTLSPSSPSFSIDGASTTANTFLQRVITTGDTGAALNWTASSSVPWLTVTGSGASGANAILTLVPAELDEVANGQRTAVVTFTYSGPGVVSATRSANVILNLNLPTVNYVVPYVSYANEPEEVVVRGSGFSQANLPDITFGGVPAQNVIVRSDTEIRALPPTGLAAGTRPQVSIDNVFGLQRSRAELVVRNHPNYPYAARLTGIGQQNQHVIYDAERDAVISARAYFEICCEPTSFVTRFVYNRNDGTWRMQSRGFTLLFDIAMSPDGRDLLVLTATHLFLVDPVTLTNRSGVLVGNFSGGTASQMAVTNDGRVIIRDAGQAYSLLTGTLDTVPGFAGTVGIDMSPDGSRATTGAATNSGDVPLSYYDSSTGTVQPTTAFQYYSRGSLDRSATKSLSGEFVRNADFSVFGELRDGGIPTLGDILSPDGERVYIYRTTPGSSSIASAQVFDTRVSMPVLPELSPITLPQADHPGMARLLLSLDSRTLFFVGSDHFVVQPVP